MARNQGSKRAVIYVGSGDRRLLKSVAWKPPLPRRNLTPQFIRHDIGAVAAAVGHRYAGIRPVQYSSVED